MTREEKAQFCIDNKKGSPAFQFYPDNWWGSRHVAAMTAEQRGIHASLIFSAWLEPVCGIPENEVCLSARISDDKKNEAIKVLEWCWFLYGGFWFCERLLKERIKQIELSNIRVSTGSKGGRPLKSKAYKNKPIDNQLDSKQKPKITKSEEENCKQKIEEEIEIRKQKFNESVLSITEYPVEMLNNFIRYWSEPNQSNKKMRFELEKTWSLKGRLTTWASRDKNFNQGNCKIIINQMDFQKQAEGKYDNLPKASN